MRYTITYEKIHVLIHYACGHDAIRAEIIGYVGSRERWSYERCQHCTEQIQSRYNLREFAAPKLVEVESEAVS